MGCYFILRDDDVVEETDFEAWSSWYETSFKKVEVVAETTLATSKVSTRFLAMTLGLSPDTAPLVFETRVEGGWLDSQTERFATLDEARAGHQQWVDRARESEDENQLPPPGISW